MSDLDIENRNLVSVFDKLKALVTKHSFALRPVTLVQRKRFQNKTKPVTQWRPDLLRDTPSHQSDSYVRFYRQQISTTHLWSFDLAVAQFTISEYGSFWCCSPVLFLRCHHFTFTDSQLQRQTFSVVKVIFYFASQFAFA